ncbi:hypothetical protein [Gloeobacter kilaueensis]|uniref:Uncharacterized protein n=1 Tax=Gloeobacter kilaueensis (strain ATCC BAA-2537 / CCAP 1431/1 / ULC 316 / JS1) TaxID=1183438 RepID=U5QGJ8_GLOK1|nr:hypothetical protein [Gloeobacter kilaueensis]AGY58092.1 hypothetical protein GKIL_1846 [Gloeobacter kilaueensis JS1]
MFKPTILLLSAALVVLPVQSAFAEPVLLAQEGSADVKSGGDSPAELRAFFEKELKKMQAEIDVMRRELSAMKTEMAAMKKEFPPNRKS